MKIRFTFYVILVWLVIMTMGCSKRVVDMEQVSPEEKIVIKFSHVVAENTPKGLAAQRFASLVKERTQGRVEVQVFPNSTLYRDGEEIQALQAGAVHMIAPATSKLSGLFPQWQVFDLPYAFADKDAVHRAMEGQIGGKLYQGLEQSNLYPLAFWDSGFKQMTNSRRPLVHPEDFTGLTFRVMINSQVLKRQFEKLGAKPVEVNFDDLYRTLESSEVDGEENTMSNIISKNLYKVQPHLTVSNHGFLGYVVLTDKTFWEGLPREVRDIMVKTMAEVTQWERQQAAKLDQEAMDRLTASGTVQVHYQTEAEKREWYRVLRPVYDEFRSVIGDDIIDSIEGLYGQPSVMGGR